MKPGPKRTPATQKQARGTSQRMPDVDFVDIVAPSDLPQQPTWLTEAGRDEWHDLIGRVSSNRMATEADSALFATLCNLQGAIALAWSSGSVPPASYLMEARRLSELFGLAGASSRLVRRPANGEPNPFARNGKRGEAP